MFNFLKNISTTEVIIVVVILIVLFGSRIIARLGRTTGETVKEIKNIKKEFKKGLEDDSPRKKK